MIQYLMLFSGLALGLVLGMHDSANAFGTAVATRVVRFRTSIFINSIMVLFGSLLCSQAILDNLSCLAVDTGIRSSDGSSFYPGIIVLCTCLCILVMRLCKLPFSLNQALLGAMLGWGCFHMHSDFGEIFFSHLHFPLAWILTPIVAAGLSWLLIRLIKPRLSEKMTSIQVYDWTIRIGYLVSGALCAFSIGQNSAASIGALFYDPNGNGLFANSWVMSVFGGLSIALGVLLFSRRTTVSMGTSIAKVSQMDCFLLIGAAAFAVLLVGNFAAVPVSTTQALIGGVFGAGLACNAKRINYIALIKVVISWLGAPLLAGSLSFVVAWLIEMIQR